MNTMYATIVDRNEGPNESSAAAAVASAAAAVAAAAGPPSFVFVTPKTKATTTSTMWRPPLPSSRQLPLYPHLIADTPATTTTYPYFLDAASFDTDDDDILQGLQELADYQDDDEDEEHVDGRSQGHHHHDHEYPTNLPPTTPPTFPTAPRIRHRWQPRHRRNSSDMSSIDMPDLTMNKASLPLPSLDKNNNSMRRGSYSTSATSLSSSIESSSPNKQQTSTTTTTTTSSSNNINNKFKRMSLHQFVTANPSAILSVQANTRLNW
jgi:hypothetical protein